MEYCYDCNYPVKISKEEWDKNEGDYGWFAYCSKCEYKKKTLKEEKKQIDILKSQSVWKIYFGAVLQDIREPNWREEEEEDHIKCDRCNANTYRSHQEYPDTWRYDYMAYCKDCKKEMNED